MKVALVYDRINKWGGAERVLLALHKLFPKAPVFTSVYSPKHANWANEFDVNPSFLQKFSHIVTNHELYPFLMPIAFERFSFAEYELVISVTSEAAKGIITKPGTKHICYCLTPTRYLWSGYDEYFKNPVLKMVASPAVSYLKSWDQIAAKRPDRLVAISKEVQDRIKKYYGLDSFIIYPPVELTSKNELLGSSLKKNKKGKGYLIVSRLSKFTKYKRIDLAIQACNELKLPLQIIGEGSWKKELEQMAGPTIEFIGNVDDTQLVKYYQNCRALLFPAIEDFGLTIVEAQSFGKPVIAFRGGGALETVKEGKTGIFFDKQTKDSLIHALLTFENMHFDPAVSKKNARQFSQNSFKTAFLKLVHQLV
ncbi:MAG TPA: glycosyltransferase [Candidatus Sulfotelmatobacter sp.]|jgi:glycosyltransferase involved in cell wall biosynthesis|nr:glycosyltransferase [Candidatus Sulfotelmatobacter sp.]